MASFLHTAMRTVFPHATYPGERGRRQLIHARAGDAHYRFLDALPRSIPDAFARSFPAERQAGLVALGNVLRTVGALLLMCDPRDLGVSIGEEISRGLRCFEPNLYLYDNYSGGIGQSQPLYRLVRATPKPSRGPNKRLPLRKRLSQLRRTCRRSSRRRQ
jgi:hypothetical protein